jgi:broad specificity phosphatase PhoE
MSRLFAALARHGDYHQLSDTPSAHQPFALNTEGEGHARKSAEAISSILEQHDWSLLPVFNTSRMLRAWQTARIMAGELENVSASDITLSSFDELAERCVGSAANLTRKQIEEIVHQDPRFNDLPADWKSNSHVQLPFQGAESLMQSGHRVATYLTRVMSELAPTASSGSLKVFVGHGASFRHAAYHLGVLDYDEVVKLSMFHGQPIFLEYIANDNWKHIAGEWKIRAQNSDKID